MSIQQGDIFDIDGSPWVVVDAAHDRFGGSASVHCSPILSTLELRLDLDVDIGGEEAVEANSQLPIGIQPLGVNGFASLTLIQKQPREKLTHLIARAHAFQIETISRNLITMFSIYSFDFDTVRRMPPPPDEPVKLYPGMILAAKGERVCIVDHWGCFNNYPLLYVAPVEPDLARPTPLDVDISAEYSDLFHHRYFVRTNEFFQVEQTLLDFDKRETILMLRYGLLRKITRAYALKFGQLSLLL